MRRIGLAVLVSLGSLVPALAQTAAQVKARPSTDWPCRAIKVADISLAAVWSGPPISDIAASAWRDDAGLSALATLLAARRTPIEAAEQAAHDFAAAQGADRRDKLLALFAAVFDRMAHERAQVIAGLDRFGRRQKDLADQIRTETADMRAEQDKAGADPARMLDLTNRMTWDMRIFEDKRKSVAYVCETPVLIEQRLFALGRIILKELE